MYPFLLYLCYFFFFKQKTAYEMRISDWSSDVCSSDLLSAWRAMVQRVTSPRDRVRVAVIGKYTELVDSYKSVQEALIHGGIANDVGVDISWLSSDLFTGSDRAREILAGFHGVLVPGGFGVRGVAGMVEAICCAREDDLQIGRAHV